MTKRGPSKPVRQAVRPKPPDWFCSHRKKEHARIVDQMVELGILGHASSFAIDRLASLRVEWGRLAQAVAEDPSPQGEPHPLANQVRKCESESRLIERELGIDLSSYDRHASPDTGEDDEL